MEVPDTKMRPVFVVGCERSGTSALWRALCQHPALRPQSEQGRRQDVAKELWFLYEFFLGQEKNLHRPYADSDVAREFEQEYAGFVGQYCQRVFGSATGRWVSAYNGDAFYLDRILSLYPGAQALFLVRHPQETVWSHLHAPWARVPDTRRERARHVRRLCQHWVRHASCHRDVAAGPHGDRVLLVRHADLLGRAADVCAEVLQFLGEAADEAVPASLGRITNSSFDRVGAGQARLQERRAEIAADPVFCRQVVRWTGVWMNAHGFEDLAGRFTTPEDIDREASRRDNLWGRYVAMRRELRQRRRGAGGA